LPLFLATLLYFPAGLAQLLPEAYEVPTKSRTLLVLFASINQFSFDPLC